MMYSRNAILTVVLLLLACLRVGAQSPAPKIEIGGHYTFINFHSRCGGCDEMRNGFGGRLTYNITPSVAVEGVLNFFPGDVFKIVTPPSTFPKPRLQGLFGVKAGIRKDRFGVFGVVRPGFMHFTPVTDCSTTDFSSCRDVLKTEFAMDFGGVAEAYLSRHVVVRLDVTDAYLRFGDTKFLEADTGPGGPVVGQFTKPGFQNHNLQISIGAGFRF